MAEIVVAVEGIAELLRRVERAASAAVLRAAMVRATALVQNRLVVYPPAQRRPQPFKTDKQRRFFFAALREGRIEVPYRRTMTLGRRWTTEISGSGLDLVGRVGNNTSYGPFVMARADQAAYHAGVWPLAEDVAEQATGDVLGIFTDAVQAALG
jgi:hypothetical protein